MQIVVTKIEYDLVRSALARRTRTLVHLFDDLVAKGALLREDERRYARCHLDIAPRPRDAGRD
jgi:hypothetical protein